MGAPSRIGWPLMAMGVTADWPLAIDRANTTHGHGSGGSPTVIFTPNSPLSPRPTTRLFGMSQSEVPFTAALPHTCTLMEPRGQPVPRTIIS